MPRFKIPVELTIELPITTKQRELGRLLALSVANLKVPEFLQKHNIVEIKGVSLTQKEVMLALEKAIAASKTWQSDAAFKKRGVLHITRKNTLKYTPRRSSKKED